MNPQLHYMINGLGGSNHSSLVRLLNSGMNPAVLRPWAEEDQWGRLTGRNFITMQAGVDETGNPVEVHYLTNAPTIMRRSDWLLMDQAVIEEAQPVLRIWGDIYGTNPYNIPNGMGVIAVGDTIEQGTAVATISMDPIRRSERRRPQFTNRQIPLPTIHSDGSYTARQLAVSRSIGAPLDTGGIRRAARAVAVDVEKLALGASPSYQFADGTVYGLTNHPGRMTKTITAPTAPGWVPKTLVDEIIAMIAQAEAADFPGPYNLYFSNAWGEYFSGDYSVTYNGNTLETRLNQIAKIRGRMRNLDYLTGWQILLVQMTQDVVQGVNGMPLTTIQWEEEGGFELRFKVVTINVPRVRANAAGVVGIVHANV